MTNQFMADTLIQWIQTSTTVLTLGHMHCLCIITLAFLMGLQHSTTTSTSPLATIKHEGHHIFNTYSILKGPQIIQLKKMVGPKFYF